MPLNYRFGANKFPSKHIGHTAWSFHELNRDHPILIDCDHPIVKLKYVYYFKIVLPENIFAN
jgi:hypothetical protein